jgi:hypothetical protein
MSRSGLVSTGQGRRSWQVAGLAAALVAITAGGLAASSAASAAPATASANAGSKAQTICSHPNKSGTNPGAFVDGVRYRVQDDRFGSLDSEQCLTLTPGGRPAFRVSTSRAASPGNPVQAFPYIQYGCYWGWCTRGSALPLRVSSIHSATSSWYTSERARGTWNAGYDLWLNSTRLANGHADRAELMIWLNATTPHYKVGGLSGTKKVKVAGRWFYVTHWRTGYATFPGGWEYVQYRLAGAHGSVHNLRIASILQDAARRHLISSSWYLQGILAGDEIWSGGQGLATTWFSVAVDPKHRATKPLKPHRPKCGHGHPLCPKTQPPVPTGPGIGGPPVPLTTPFGF